MTVPAPPRHGHTDRARHLTRHHLEMVRAMAVGTEPGGDDGI